LKRLVADLALDKHMLAEALRKRSKARPPPPTRDRGSASRGSRCCTDEKAGASTRSVSVGSIVSMACSCACACGAASTSRCIEGRHRCPRVRRSAGAWISWRRVHALEDWAFAHGVPLDFIRPGKPVENAFIEAFNGPP
jgi:hypothetical protein